MAMEYYLDALFCKAEDVVKSLIALKNFVRKDGRFNVIFHFSIMIKRMIFT